MIVVTNERSTQPGTDHNGIKGTGYRNHNPKRSKILHTFDILFDEMTQEKSIFSDRKSIKEQVIIPAFERAGSTNPKAMANTIFPMLLKEKKIIEV